MALTTYENLLSSASDYTDWTAQLATLAATADPWGGTNATRITNSDLTNDFHRGYISTNTTPTASPFFVTLYVKGTAGNCLFLFTSGSAFNVDLSDGTETASTSATLVSAALVGNSWRKVVVQCTDFGSGVFQLCSDAPGVSSTFTPPSTSTYVDVIPQLSNDSDYLPYFTTGTAVAALSLPAGEAWQATAQGQTDIQTAISSGGGTTIANVLAGGVLNLKENDTHTVAAANEVSLTQPDVGGALHTLLTATGTTVTVGLRRDGGDASEIAGTVGSITYSADVTTIPIEFTAASTTGKVGTDWTYDVQATLSGGEIVTHITGDAIVSRDNA